MIIYLVAGLTSQQVPSYYTAFFFNWCIPRFRTLYYPYFIPLRQFDPALNAIYMGIKGNNTNMEIHVCSTIYPLYFTWFSLIEVSSRTQCKLSIIAISLNHYPTEDTERGFRVDGSRTFGGDVIWVHSYSSPASAPSSLVLDPSHTCAVRSSATFCGVCVLGLLYELFLSCSIMTRRSRLYFQFSESIKCTSLSSERQIVCRVPWYHLISSRNMNWR